ncbi:MAG: response regulator [Acidobacteria bacterium ACB2]|nr:response regulator [Acidobacteria bacterium ACB2]
MSRVGIVEDDAGCRRALARLLRASGQVPVTFGSAEEYLRSAGEVDVDCLVVDVQLGGMSGFELQKRLAGTETAPPVVFLTAADEDEASRRAAAAGCAFVRKSAPAGELLHAIQEAVVAGPTHPKV